jgi:hypothetical protein
MRTAAVLQLREGEAYRHGGRIQQEREFFCVAASGADGRKARRSYLLAEESRAGTHPGRAG